MTDTVSRSNRDLAVAGLALAAFAIFANIPYAALIALFDYDDVLRRPAGEVLTLFRAGGQPLVIAWWGFAMAALGFAVAAGLAGEALARRGVMPRWATMLGVASGLIQAAALLRWVFVVPYLAHTYAAGDGGTHSQAIAAYEMLNLYAGAALGEHLGQLLIVVWTAMFGIALIRLGGALRWAGAAGLATLPAWLAGQSEMLSLALPSLPVFETIPLAFMAWELWLIVTGVMLIAKRAG